MNRNALVGAIVWLGLTVGTQLNKIGLDWIELMFLFAPLVVIPVGLGLTRRVDEAAAQPPGRDLSLATGGFLVSPGPERIARLIQLPCALGATASFLLPRGAIAGSLAAGWLVFCTLLGLGGATRFYRGALRRLDSAFPVVAFLYLAIGAAWLVASRLGLTPLNFQEPIVLLTAVHFHYAGFAAPLLARSARVALACPKSGTIRVALVSSIAFAVMASPGMLAAGFVIGPRAKLAAAVLLAVGEIGLAFCFLFALRRPIDGIAKTLIALAAGSVICSMVLAALWAVGEYPLQPFVHLAEMARFHGAANAFGFSLCGLAGWARATETAHEPERSKRR